MPRFFDRRFRGHRDLGSFFATTLIVREFAYAFEPLVRCKQPAFATSTSVLEGERCQLVSDGFVHVDLAVESCVARAFAGAGAPDRYHDMLPALHVGGVNRTDASVSLRCVIEICEKRPGQTRQRPHVPDNSPEWSTLAPQELCPGGIGSPVVLPEVTPNYGIGDDANIEFVKTFGPLRLRHDQEIHSFRGECSATAHRFVAEVCFGGMDGGCDEWSKYSLPRCHISLAVPYDPALASFLYAPACERTGQLLCPPSVPVALQVSLKSGSRSAAVWAAMLEGLLPGLVAVRRSLSASLADTHGHKGENRMSRYITDWLEHEELRLGCSSDASLFSVSRALHLLADDNHIGLPLSLCPTCCKNAAGRLRVVFVRDPTKRLKSYFNGYWQPRKGHLLTAGDGFAEWVELILSPSTALNRTLFEADDLDHVAPAFKAPADYANGRMLVFSLEDVGASQQRVERALCQKEFGFCLPLPDFPPSSRQRRGQSKRQTESLPLRTQALVDQHFRHDFAALRDAADAAVASHVMK